MIVVESVSMPCHAPAPMGTLALASSPVGQGVVTNRRVGNMFVAVEPSSGGRIQGCQGQTDKGYGCG